MMEQFAQYGLIGLMVGGIYYGVGWCVIQLLGTNGILRGHNKAIESVSACLSKHHENSTAHAQSCVEANTHVSVLHRAAGVALDELEAECAFHGVDVSERVTRIRNELRETR